MKTRIVFWTLLFVLSTGGCKTAKRPYPKLPPDVKLKTATAKLSAVLTPVPLGFPDYVTRVPEKIHRNPAGGWMTVMKGFQPANSLSLAKWSSAEDLQFTSLEPSDFDLGIDSAFHGPVNGAYIVGGAKATAFYSQPEVREFNPVTGKQLLAMSYGHPRDTVSTAVPMSNGGLAGVTFSGSAVLPNNTVRFTAFYRRPSATYATNNWWFKQYEFPSEFGTAALIYFADCVQDSNGVLWVFFVRDSAGTVGLARFAVDGDELRLLDFDQRFINTGLSISPSHEFPRISSVLDESRARILLCYQNASGAGSSCPDREITSFWSVSEVGYDKAARLVATSAWTSPHIDFPKPAIFPRTNGIYFTLLEQNLQTCELFTHQGIIENSQYRITKSNPGNGRILGFSPDGWFIFHDWDTGKIELLQTQFGPKMTLARSRQSIVLNWDQARPSDVLQGSINLTNWVNISTGLPPAILRATGAFRAFRVKP